MALAADLSATRTGDLPRVAAAPRYEGVQALRFVAALSVVMLHVAFYTRQRLVDAPLSFWEGANWGVDIFFVISGFVMMVSARGLIGHPNGARIFMLRRILRIVPVYWIATTIKVAVLLAAPTLALHNAFDLERVILSYLFLPSRNPAGVIEPIHGVGWTLIFEMFFYALFALAMLLRAPVIPFVGAVLAVCAGLSAFRDEAAWPAAAFYFDPMVLQFFWGMLIGRVALQGPPLHPALGVALVAAGLLLLLSPAIAGMTEGFPRIGVGPAMLVAGVVILEPYLAGRVPPPLLLLGDASYSLYIFHPIMAPAVPAVFARLGLIEPDLAAVIAIVGSVVGSVIIYKLVEAPIDSRLRRLFRAAITR